MATQVQNRRGSTAEHGTFTGAVGELTVDTDKDVVVVHDGTTAGGHPMLKQDGSNSAFALGSAGAPSLKFTGDTNTGIYSPGADQLAISTGGTGRLFVDSAGKTTIGGSGSSTCILQLKLPAGNANQLTIAHNDEAQYGRLDLGYFSNGAFIGTYAGTSSAADLLRLGTSGAERARIRADGMFEIKGAGTAGVSPAFSVSGSAPSNSLVILPTTGYVGLGTSSPQTNLHVIGTNNGECTRIDGNSGASDRNLVFSNSGNSIRWLINSQGGSTGAGELGLQTNSTTRLFIDSSGRVGIGTTSPGNLLHVSGSNDVLRLDSATTTAGILLFDSVGGSRIGTRSANIIFDTGSLERARLDTSGRLLVGTSSAYGSATLLELHSSTQFGPQLLQRSKAADAFPTYFIGQKIRNTSIVQSGDGLASFVGEGYDGASYIAAARIDFSVDGAPGSTVMPGRLVFSTNSGTAGASPTERLRITNAGVLQIADAGNISVGTTTGTKIGTATTQKLGFYNATPVVQPAAVADATDAASAITQLNALLARMRSLGLIAT